MNKLDKSRSTSEDKDTSDVTPPLQQLIDKVAETVSQLQARVQGLEDTSSGLVLGMQNLVSGYTNFLAKIF